MGSNSFYFYMNGYQDGYAGKPIRENVPGLMIASEYREGHAEGTKERERERVKA